MRGDTENLRQRIDREDKETVQYISAMTPWSFYVPWFAPFIVAYLADEKWVIATSAAVIGAFVVRNTKLTAGVLDRLRMTNLALLAIIEDMEHPSGHQP